MLDMPYTATGSRYAAGYIRESSEDADRDPDAQKAGQREDVTTVAQRNGTDPATLLWYDDWGRSGSEHAKRPAQERLLADVRAGRIAVIYARSLDRLMRSTQRLRDLWTECGKTGTRIVTQREGDVSADKIEANPSAWMFVQSIMSAAEYESRVGRVRARASVATKKREGTPTGQVPYGKMPGEDVNLILDAFKEAGSFLGTAKRLNAAGIPPRRARKWDTHTVAGILRDNGAAPPPGPSSRGVRATAPHIFTGLLRCDFDNDVLTSMPRGGPGSRQRNPSVAYYCRDGHRDTTHPRPYVIAEGKVLAWAKMFLADFTTLYGARVAAKLRAAEGDDTMARRAALVAKRNRWIEQYGEGLIDKAERDRRLADVQEEMAQVEPVKPFSILSIPGGLTRVSWIEWDGAPADVNAQLRRLWSAIRLHHTPAKSGKLAIFAPVDVDWLPGAREWVEGIETPEEKALAGERYSAEMAAKYGSPENHPYNRAKAKA
jgi:DNA invertase Pin-like site-specific DNA recombinase